MGWSSEAETVNLFSGLFSGADEKAAGAMMDAPREAELIFSIRRRGSNGVSVFMAIPPGKMQSGFRDAM
jgi:hypothetical protein